MRHFVVLLAVVAVAYLAWHLASPLSRRDGVRFLARHGLRLAVVAAVLLGLLALAYHLPSIPLL